MSYNDYNQYSPYYQQNSTTLQQQAQQQSNSNPYAPTARLNDNYSSSQYQPLSAYQSDLGRKKQPQSGPGQPGFTSQSSNYGGSSQQATYSGQNVGSVGTSAAGDQSRLEAYSSSSPDTTALGNLAYASSLGQNQNQPSLSQIIESNRARGASNYSASGNYSTELPMPQNHQRAGSGALANSSDQQSRQSQLPPVQYQSTISRPSYGGQDYNNMNAGRSSPAQYRYSTPPQPQQPSQSYRQYAPPVSRPASGQGVQRPTSGIGRQSNQPIQTPSTYTDHATPQSNGRYHHGLPQTSGVQSDPRPSPSAASSAYPAPSPQMPTQTDTRQSKTSAVKTSKKPSKKQKKPLDVDTNVVGNVSPQPTPSEDTQPTTVNPNQVFNHYEHQRRQERAEAARKAASATPNLPPAGSPPADDVTQAAKALMGQSSSKRSDSATKEQIELEMKQMIEKMRDYKAKDPGLFSQVWEEVKKGQPAQASSARQSISGPAASPTVNGQAISPQQADLPAESDLPAASFPPDFDRGRYPMQRRRRGNATFTPDKKTSHKKKTVDANAQLPIDLTAPEASIQSKKRKGSGLSKELAAPAASPQAPGAGSKQVSPNTAPQVHKPESKVPVGKTHWPEHKKRALAEAARQALLASPSNVGITISANEIHTLLDGNPSYYQLCEHLESRGFVIDRSQFARLLLTAVPNLSQKQPQATPKQNGVPAPPPYQVPNGYVPYGSPQATNPFQAPVANMQGSVGQQGTDQLNVQAKLENDISVPQSKEEKAKKRSFGDIVDLSMLSDEDEFVRHRPKPRIEQPKPAAPTQNLPQEPAKPLSNDALFQKWGMSGSVKETQSLPHHPSPKNPLLGKSHRSGREHLLYEKVVEPMNKRQDALRRSNYDPKTICRDILLASGRHPTMPSLNSHLEGLSERFVSVDINSDLSTFRWDLVDPGGVPAPTPISRINQDDPDQTIKFEDKSVSNHPVMPDSGPRTAVAVGAGAQVRPDFASQPIGSVETPPIRKRGRPAKKPSTKAQTFGETRLAPSNIFAPPPIQMPTFSTPTNQPDPTSQSSNQADRSFSRFGLSSAPNSSTNHTPSAAQSSPNGPTFFRVPGRKGRPPGAKNRNPRPDKGIKKKPSSSDLQQAALPSTEAPAASIPSHVTRETSTHTRPSGLRNEITPTTGRIAVVIPDRSPSISNPGSARRDSVQEQPSDRRPPSPSYKVYKCQWQNCPAELHNLDVLRKHVRKQHRERLGPGPWPCKWADCSSSQSSSSSGKRRRSNDDASGGGHQRLMFADADAWDRHVERRHLGKYAWELGDGPAPYPSDVESSDYLSDSQHRRVSPRAQASGSKHRADPLPLNTGPKVATEYHDAHDNETDDEKAIARTKALTAKKKGVGGMGIYKTGSKLVSEAKRRLLGASAEAEGVEEVDGDVAGGEDGSSEESGKGSEVDFEKV